MRKYFLLSILLLSFTLPAHAATMNVLTPKVLPGQTVIASFDEAPVKIMLNDKLQTAFPYQKGWRVVVPLPLATKIGTQTLVAKFERTTITKNIFVAGRKPLVINLPVPPKLNQTPKQLVQNLATTNTGINQLVQQVTSDTKFSTPFGLPLFDNRKMSSLFGEVRITTAMDSAGSPQAERINHLGVDFVMPKGTKVAAINDGVVTKSYLDPVYGNSIFIDHGRGIFTLYLHLDTMRVKAGDVVKKGKVIGTLGETGLASAPHLHLSLKINGISVDPLQFVANFK